LPQKKVRFDWKKDCNDSFCKVKSILISCPVLLAPDFAKQSKFTVDASEVGIGAALFQQNSDNVDKVVSYFSKILTKYQQNYSTIEKECLALLLALQILMFI
jgi:hypothetical protein